MKTIDTQQGAYHVILIRSKLSYMCSKIITNVFTHVGIY